MEWLCQKETKRLQTRSIRSRKQLIDKFLIWISQGESLSIEFIKKRHKNGNDL
jgi:hypothetical protein